MNIYQLNPKYTINSEPILFFATSYAEAEDLCKLSYPKFPIQEIRFLSSKILFNIDNLDKLGT